MPGSGELDDGLFERNFKSQANFDAREKEHGVHNQDPVNEHPDDAPQSKHEAVRTLGQFFIQSENVTYSGWEEKEGCKCAIGWDGELAIYDTPGVTTGPNDDAQWSAIVGGILGLRVNGGRQEIGRHSVGGWVCCKEK